MQDFLSKVRAGKTVLQRTRPAPHLPSPVLYVAWLSGEAKRRVVDTAGQTHELADAVVQSQYKLLSGARAKALFDEHWRDATTG